MKALMTLVKTKNKPMKRSSRRHSSCVRKDSKKRARREMINS